MPSFPGGLELPNTSYAVFFLSRDTGSALFGLCDYLAEILSPIGRRWV